MIYTKKLIRLNGSELSHLISYSAEIGKALTGALPSGALYNSEENKPFIQELIRFRSQKNESESEDAEGST